MWIDIKTYRPLLDHLVVIKSAKYPGSIGIWIYKHPQDLDEDYYWASQRIAICNALGVGATIHPREITHWMDVNFLYYLGDEAGDK